MSDSGAVGFYSNHITAYEREFEVWEKRVEKILQRYRDEKRTKGSARFNILWSNVQTLKSATFSRMPQPDVSRRFKDNDPVGRVAAQILERALMFEVDHYKDFGATIRQCVYDRFLGGRGTAWVRYEPTFIEAEQGEPEQAPDQISEDVPEPTESLEWECAPVDYVHWKDFGHSIARTWEEVTIIWRKVYMTRKTLTARFGKDGETIPLDSMPQDNTKLKGSADTDSVQKRALIYEIWDKEAGKAFWLSKSTGKMIDEKKDPLQLEGFFPCPPPIYATLTTDSLIPLPDYTMYQDQANELDTLSDRIDGLIKALQVKGVYDASIPELARLFTEGENGTLIPVKNWAALAEKQGLKGAIDIVEILPIAQALTQAYTAFQQVKNQIYEVTGISDIIRGETNANETATAQQIKNSYASMRLKTYQDEVERLASRILQIKAQIICTHFDDQTIAKIAAVDQLSDADKPYIQPALEMLRDNMSRAFRVEISTDSMAYLNESQEKQDRTEFLGAVGNFIGEITKAAQISPELLPLGAEMLKFGVTGFRVGRQIEGTIDAAIDEIKAKQKQQAANPQPDPEMMKMQAEQQSQQMSLQAEQQGQQMKMQQEAQLAQAGQQHDAALEQMKTQGATNLEQMRLQFKQQSEQLQRSHDAQIAAMGDDFNRWKVKTDNDAKILVAVLAKAEAGDGETGDVVSQVSQQFEKLTGMQIELTQQHAELINTLNRPKKVMRDPQTDKIIGVQ